MDSITEFANAFVLQKGITMLTTQAFWKSMGKLLLTSAFYVSVSTTW